MPPPPPTVPATSSYWRSRAAQVPGRRCWAIEGAGSFGAGLATFLADHGEQVVEVPRRRRSARRYAAKSDALDAVQIARDALVQTHPAMVRRRGDREALRVLLTTRRNAVNARIQTVNQLKALIVSAPEELRAELRGRGTKAQISYCAALRRRPTRSLEHQMTARALQVTARRLQQLRAEVDTLPHDIHGLVTAIAPWLLELPGVGPITAAQVLISWSHAGRWRSEAAFAALAGTSPIPASSGRVTRYRLNRRGDRQLNNALHTIAVVRLRDDPLTRAYAQRRTAQGKNPARSSAASSASPASSTSSWNATTGPPWRSPTPLDRHSSLGITVAEFIPRQVMHLQQLLTSFPLLRASTQTSRRTMVDAGLRPAGGGRENLLYGFKAGPCHGVHRPPDQGQGRPPGQAFRRGCTMTEANVSFAGNLTDDPELRHTEGGIARAMFRVAVSARKDQEASFFTVIVWRDQAEHAAQSLSKGSRVVVVGRLQQRTWTAEDGSARSVVEVVAEELGPSLRWRRRRPGRRGARTTSQVDKRCDERTRKHASVPLRRVVAV
jgi:transposase